MSWWVTIVVNAAHNVAQLFKNKEDRTYKTITSNGDPEAKRKFYADMGSGVPEGMYVGVDDVGYQIAPVRQTLASIRSKSSRFGDSPNLDMYVKVGKDNDGNDLYILKLEYRVQPKFPEDLIKLKSYYPMSIVQNIMPNIERQIFGVDELETVTVTAERLPNKPETKNDNNLFTVILIFVGVSVLGVNYYRNNK